MRSGSVVAGRYRVERRLGAGAMADVHLARDTELDRPVAVKALADGLRDDAEVHRRFLREGRLAARLAHPNVVAVFDAGEEDGRPYLVLEYVEGETAADLVRRRGRLPVGEALRLVLQACDALEHAHAVGLVHRDVKPQNLLVRPDGALKVADFGIARAVEGTRLTEAGTILGTAAYLAPEQAAGEEVGPAADVYALGAVLYELLAGRPPFQDASLADLARRSREEPVAPPPLPADVPDAVEDVVMRALARRPEYRPDSARAFGEALRAAAGEEPTAPLESTRPLEPPTQVTRRRRRVLPGRRGRAAIAAGAASLVLVLAAVVAVAAVRDRPEPGAGPATVEPVPAADTPGGQARNLAAWLREHAEPGAP